MRTYFRSLLLNNPWAQLLFFIITTLLFLILSTGAAHMISMLCFGATMHHEALGFLEMPEILLDQPEMIVPSTYVKIMALTQIISQIGLFLIPPFLFAWIIHDRPVTYYLTLNSSIALFPVLLIFPLVFLTLPLVSWLTEINQMAPLPDALALSETRAEILINLFMSDSSIQGLMLNLLMIAILPAIGEELFFRGVIQQQLARGLRNPHLAVWITAIIFSFFHFQFHGFLPRMFLGVLFGYLFVCSGNLWIPILAHLINNGAAVLVEFLSQREIIETGYAEFGTHYSTAQVILSAALTITLCLSIWHFSCRRTSGAMLNNPEEHR